MQRRRDSNLSNIPLRDLLANMQEGIVVYDAKGFITYASPGINKIIGFNENELVGRKGKDFIHPDDNENSAAILKKIRAKHGRSHSVHQRLKHKEGHYVWVESQLTNLLHKPAIKGIVSNFRDIQKQKETEDSLSEVRHLLDTINKNLSEGIFIGQLEKRFIYANKAFLKITGYHSLRELQQIKPRDLYADKKRHRKIVRDLRANGKLNQTDILVRTRNGEEVCCRMSVRLISFKGEENYFVGHIRDVTREKLAARFQEKAELELRNSNNFLQDVINTVAAPLFVKNEKHQWILFNDAFRGRRKKELVRNKTDHDFMPRKLADQIWKVDNEVLRTGRTVSTEEVHPGPDGVMRTIVTTKSRFVDDKGEKFVIGFMMDITERKRFENIIKSFNAGLRGVLESTQDQILALDKKKCYTMFNQAHAEMIRRLSGNEIKIGDNFLESIPDELVSVARRELKKAFSGPGHTTEIPLRNKTIYRVMFNAIKDDKGIVNGVAIFAEDITERKLTERKLKVLNEELTAQNWQLATQEEELRIALDQLSERNFELDQLMYKTSHDLRSPLSSILGLVNLAKLDQDATNLNQYLGKIESRVLKLDEFIKSMLNYGRVNRGELEISDVDLKDVINGVLLELEYLDNYKDVKKSIKIRNAETLFRNDRFLMTIIIGNIISNTYKYYNPESKSFLKIEIDITPVSAKLMFKDNGIGIKKEHLDKIFRMFYRATERSQGSGLGMYIVKQAVEKIGGKIQIASEYGEGTTITIEVPNL